MMDDNIVFARTPVGTSVARDSAAALPRAMRTLLLAIDGRTRVASYRMILNHLGDVALLLEGLENAGYIARTVGNQTRVAAPTPSTAPPRSNSIAQDLQALATLTTIQGPTLQSSTPGAPVAKNYDVLAKIQEAQAHFSNLPPLHANGSVRPTSPVRLANLNAAKSLMTDFLMQHLPDVAMEVSLSIDRIETFDELERSLADYSQLVARLGRVSVDHLRQVKSLVQR